ncbi:nuclease-related domain-containing protein [Carboxydothermus pertinax]|uniref:NERD domain-containing protein n=1 Tax=Carboxydothermus pertinax TaxID=870242 RepID=A0A1L8CUY5_9THEO|nr:nuclease-related domain-containing protein [Carboxydothermus pertinax]GAV22723.1 hypothetical protein cpu_12330 [Carboxydothermus pertinax]
MAKQVGKAGSGARKMAEKRTLIIYGTLLGFILAGSFLLKFAGKILLFNSYWVNLFGLLIAGVGIGVFIAVFMIATDSKEVDQPINRALKGAKAEEKISEILGQLPEGYTVFNDFPCPMGNIDHIVVGPTGIFIIETKSHSGEVTLSQEGKLLLNSKELEKDFLKQVLGQTFWLKERMVGLLEKTPFINPIIVFTNAFVKIDKPVKGVRIVNKKWLIDAINENKVQLSDEAIKRIVSFLTVIKQE